MKLLKKLSFFILIALGVLFVFQSCNTGKTSPQELTIGIQNSPSNSLIIIANRKGFFDTTKVKVTIKEFSAGKLALQALLGKANDLDIAICAETPVALSSMGGNKIKVFAEIVNAKNECRVVCRKDGELNTPEKYFGKSRKMATSQGGSPEWLTYNFVKKYNLDKNKLEIDAMLPENMPVALSNGAVDAISIFDPYARLGENELGDKGLTFLNTDITSYYVLCTKDSTLSQKSTAIEELIKGLIKADEFIKNNSDEAKKIIAEQTKIDIGILNSTWSNYTFSISLSKDLIDLCEKQAQWAIDTKKYPEGTKIPNFKVIVVSDILNKVAPNLVKL